MRVTQDAVARHEVCFLGSDIDRDGGKLILAAGAPTSAGNDEERMLCTVRDIVDAGTAIPVRVGVNRGHVFAGDIGPAYRRTYTVMGDAVNLAARLMAKAVPGEVLASGDVVRLVRAPFSTTALEPFMVKGKSRPVQAFAIGPVVEHADGGEITARDLVPLVGRDAELAVLLDALAEIRDGRGRLVEIVGEPGIGKSRLVEELEARATGATVLRLACGLYESSTAYFPFRRLLRGLVDIAPGADTAVAGARLTEAVATRAPDLLPWLPLLAIVFDADVEPTPEVDALDETFRRERLEEATTSLLARLLEGPTLIVPGSRNRGASTRPGRTGSVPGTPWHACGRWPHCRT